jgi:hypothetical protein
MLEMLTKNGIFRMQALRLVLCRLSMALAIILVLGLGITNAAPLTKDAKSKTVNIANAPTKDAKSKTVNLSKPLPKTKKNLQAIVGETEENDALPIDEVELKPDYEEPVLVRSENADGSPLNKRRDQKTEKILEGFRQAHKFHETWHHLPPTKVKSSHENLIKFCKVACVKKNCMDRKIADKCHLMCPESTTKQCRDPLRDADYVIEREEVHIKNAQESAKSVYPPDLKNHDNAIAQAERNIPDSESEG